MKTPYIAYSKPPFSSFVQLLLSPALFIAISLAEYVVMLKSRFLLYNILDLHLSSFGTLVPAVPCCVFYTTRHHGEVL